MAIDNTHTKYLKGRDKKVWNGFKETYEAQQKLENFMAGFKIPENIKDGEEIEIPVRKNNKKKKNKEKN